METPNIRATCAAPWSLSQVNEAFPDVKRDLLVVQTLPFASCHITSGDIIEKSQAKHILCTLPSDSCTRY